MKYDYLIVGAGLFGSVFAQRVSEKGKKCLIIEKKNHIAGQVYTENRSNIEIHVYGAHIFHTSNKIVWDYVNRFAEFNNFINCPIAIYKDQLYNLPFNMNTFSKMWNIKSPEEAKQIINKQIISLKTECPKNLEEQAINLVGIDIYEKLIKGYTKKQWGTDPKNLPSFIIKRLPVRFTYDNNYFNDLYQGIPKEGYTKMVNNILKGIEVRLETNYFDHRDYYDSLASKVVFTGKIDEYFDYQLGILDYRALKFEHQLLDIDNYQGNAVVNFTDENVPYTRIIEHKHFNFGIQNKTIITKEYSIKWNINEEAYYPINDQKNNDLYQKYFEMSIKKNDVIFGGRLAEYKYYDMHNIIDNALKVADKEIK